MGQTAAEVPMVLVTSEEAFPAYLFSRSVSGLVVIASLSLVSYLGPENS